MELWASVAIGLALLALVAVLGARLRSGRVGSRVLDKGWQFYSPPTSDDPPGTVFRIDAQGRRFAVSTLKPAVTVATEAYGRRRESVNTRMSVIARTLGIPVAITGQAETDESIELELKEPTREYVTDEALDPVLGPWLKQQEFRPGNRYFLIRESRSATEITYHLQRRQSESLGGEASLARTAPLEGRVTHDHGSSGEHTLEQAFDNPMRVMFIAEELSRPLSDTAAPDLGHQTVREVLAWIDPETPQDPELEFLIVGLLLPQADRFGEAWLSAASRRVPQKILNNLGPMVWAEGESDANLRREFRDRAKAALRSRIGADPEARLAVEGLARWPEVTFTPNGDQEARMLEQHYAMLGFVFDRVDRLGRPVALPGFFNGADCVAIVDARTDRNSISLPERPDTSVKLEGRPCLWLAVGSSAPGAWLNAADRGTPRVWLIRRQSDDARRELLSDLNARFAAPNRLLPNPFQLGVELTEKHGAELVEVIFSDWVRVFQASSLAPSAGDPFYAIGDRVGIQTLREDLERQLRERWDNDPVWREILLES